MRHFDRMPSVVCWTFLALIVVGSSAQAEFVPRTFQAVMATSPPVIDGTLDDSVWTSAPVMNEFFAYQSGGDPAAAATSAQVAWDEQFLYLAFEMADVDIRPSCVIANRCGRDAQLYLGDVIELFVRESRDLPRYFEFEWSPDQNDVFDARFDDRKFGPPGTSWNTDIQWAVHVNGSTDDATDQDAGWIVESAIPLSAFDPITVGSEWTFTVARYDYFNAAGRTEQLMMLTPGDPDLPRAGLASGFHTYELYDNLKFAPEPLNFGVILAAMVMFLLRRSVRGC
ncbi:MAG: carbohydrate-binding family 9-like protein [Planctomycetales bacterium]|nr:carbohydrate-binding family 9-like protein [Planctomycetales bacterium]